MKNVSGDANWHNKNNNRTDIVYEKISDIPIMDADEKSVIIDNVNKLTEELEMLYLTYRNKHAGDASILMQSIKRSISKI